MLHSNRNHEPLINYHLISVDIETNNDEQELNIYYNLEYITKNIKVVSSKYFYYLFVITQITFFFFF